jgi:DNA polymerase-3 subunit chi
MTRIDFYTDAGDKLEVACRIVHKAYRSGHKVVVCAPNAEELRRLDRLLWTTPAVSFVPHCEAGDPLASQTPVLLASGADAVAQDDVLINLGEERPAEFARYQRLVEIVSLDASDRAKARARYKFYRDRGYEISTHSMSAAAGT